MLSRNKCKTSLKFFAIIFTTAFFISLLLSTQIQDLTNALPAEKPSIILGNPKWESVELGNSIASYILEQGYGYKVKIVEGTSSDIKSQLRSNKVDVLMEYWIDPSLENIDSIIKNKEMNILSINFSDADQGVYIPAYVVKGDLAKGIKPIAPGLKTVNDLKRYASVFKESPTSLKGTLIGGVKSWDSTKIISKKFSGYGLNKQYQLKSLASEEALNQSLISAIEKYKPWAGYYWTPSWVMGKYNMIKLSEPAYNKNTWVKTNLCAFPGIQVSIVSSNDFLKKAPDAAAFLRKYKTDAATLNDALAYKHDRNVSFDKTARWFLREHQDLVYAWLSEEIANKVMDSLDRELVR